jgi:excisionase family DNA binding protein
VSDLSPRQAASELGVSRSLVYRLIEQGELQAYRVSNRLRIERRSLDGLRSRNRIRRRESPAYEPQTAASGRGAGGFADQLQAIWRDRAA